MVYGVFGGCYSDWYVVGYFNDRVDADKYCAAFGDNDYYVMEIKNLEGKEDLSKISLKYEHEIVFDFEDTNEWIMRDEPTRYNCYISDELKPNKIKYLGYRWVSFYINIEKDDRKLAEKIAQDYLYELLSYGESKKVYDKNVKLMNDRFLEPYKIKAELKKLVEERQRELAELARLKAKYEQNN